jgi:hypothetical protein
VHWLINELKWKQHAKVHWLQHGDKNSKFFHAAATQRKHRNNILAIKDKTRRPCSSKAEIEGAFVSYFQEPFTGGTQLEVGQCIQALDKKVTDSMNENLLAKGTLSHQEGLGREILFLLTFFFFVLKFLVLFLAKLR